MRKLIEPFSSSDFAGLKDVDGFGAPRAAAEFARDAAESERGVGVFARGAEPGMGPVTR